MFFKIVPPFNSLEQFQTLDPNYLLNEYEIQVNKYYDCIFSLPLEIINKYLSSYFKNNKPKQIFYFPTSFEFESELLFELIQSINDDLYLICYDNFWILVKEKKNLENVVDLNMNLGHEICFFICLNSQLIISNTSHGTFTNF